MLDLTSNRISHVMSEEEFAAAKADLRKVAAQLNFLVKLTPTESTTLYRLSDADKMFVRNCMTEIENISDIIPAYLKPEEIVKDLTCGEQLLELENVLADMLENVRTNRRLANTEAYNGASILYRLVGAAARSGSAAAVAVQNRMQTYHSNKRKGGRMSMAKAAKNNDAGVN